MIQQLDSGWMLAIDPRNAGRQLKWFDSFPIDAKAAPVPGTLQQVYPGYHGVAWYACRFDACASERIDDRCLLELAATDYMIDVWLNGQSVGGHEGPDTPVVLDVTSAVKAGASNLLVVRLLNPTIEPIDGIRLVDTPHRFKTENLVAGFGWNYGGLLGRVSMRWVSPVYIADVHAQPDVATGRIRVAVTIENTCQKAYRGCLALSVSAANGGGIVDSIDQAAECAAGESVHELTLTVPQRRLWQLDDPFLYRVSATIGVGENIHQHTVRCGFRDFRVERGYFRLNGRRVIVKALHTGNVFPMTMAVPTTPDMMRRDLLMVKTAGFNVIRFIAGIPFAEQLDFCDEIGLMVYEETQAGWLLNDSPKMKERFDRSIREMVIRDRNHPCVTIWGLLNETPDNAIFRNAMASLPMLRDLDESRLVLLNSGRHDHLRNIGSLSNPGSRTWEYQWGRESADSTTADRKRITDAPEYIGENAPGYLADVDGLDGMGDFHVYAPVPCTSKVYRFFEHLGRGGKPFFLSEYGIGSLLDTVRAVRLYEQHGAAEELEDFRCMRWLTERLEEGWRQLGMDDVYPSAGHMLSHGVELHARYRTLGFDLIRANPRVAGLSLTSLCDLYMAEGLWSFWREWKPGTCDALCDGWSPLRWCVFVEPTHGYAGRPMRLRAVLANEDVLPPGKYPVTLQVFGETGCVWRKEIIAELPSADERGDAPLAVEVFADDVVLNVPSGRYEFVATMERGGAPTGGKVAFYVSESTDSMKCSESVWTWGVDVSVMRWLTSHGTRCETFDASTAIAADQPKMILVGGAPGLGEQVATWKNLHRHLEAGATVIFTSASVFKKESVTATVGHAERRGQFGVSSRDFEVPNVDRSEWPIYTKEYYGVLDYIVSDLPAGKYVVELCMCEASSADPGWRVFDVDINGLSVLKNYEIIKDAGGFRRGVCRRFTASAENGRIVVNLKRNGLNVPSISRMRIYDSSGEVIVEDTPLQHMQCEMMWFPMEKKPTCMAIFDSLYHKESVGKRHAMLEALPARGIWDWDYFGEVISNRLYTGVDAMGDVAVAAFSLGYPFAEGYAIGTQLASYPCGAGQMILCTLNVLENLDRHPAADRLMINILNHAGSFLSGKGAR